MFRRRVLIGLILGLLGLVWFLNVSAPNAQPEGCFQGCASTPPWEGDVLRVLTLNVLHGRSDYAFLKQRLERIGSEISKLDVDIVLLQEVPWSFGLGNGAEFLAQQTEMNYVFARANGNKWTILFEEGEAILSRFPIREPSIFELNPQAGFFENRVVLHSVVETPQGDLDLYVTHLTYRNEKVNQAQVHSLGIFVEDSRSDIAIIGGDFNAEEDKPQIRDLSRVWIDSYRELNPTDEGLTCCVDNLTGDPHEKLEKRIDYLFFTRHEDNRLNLLDAQVVFNQPILTEDGWLWASDHLGVLVSFYLDK
jgi:endonuclease/exonuclease/phosphatase family metal-dependent hydrolase